MKKFLFPFFIGILLSSCNSTKQAATSNSTGDTKNQYKILTVAFYNLENLFDTENDPKKFDERTPIMEMPAEARPEAYRKKLHNMASVLSKIGTDVAKDSPAIIGISEVENQKVIEDLVNQPELVEKNYGIIHYESPDERGIDVALLYQKDLFRPISSSSHSVYLYNQAKEKQDYTRDQLLVTGLLDGEKMHFIVNHWPSRGGGEAASEPKRLAAAAVMKGIIDSIQAVDPYAKIMAMGDFNDNGYNKSFKEVLGSKSEQESVKLKGIYNPYEALHAQGIGSNAYRDGWDNFDQIIMTKPFLAGDYDSYHFYKAFVFNPKFMLTPEGRYKGYPFRSWGNGAFTGGYSDHFPVYVYLIKEL
ncbi:MAG TPA: endonuclease/exonuclease/phosphatase family protein [Flavobacteriaceae bacterium]|nr:endonuclease/exonuclease/phosphatase family protein [Flavobacteriaceae bacterium]